MEIDPIIFRFAQTVNISIINFIIFCFRNIGQNKV